MSDLDLAALRATAEAATSGEWSLDLNEGNVWAPGNRERVCQAHSFAYGPDAAHIASFDPPTVLALLDEVEALTRRVEHLAAGKAQAQIDRDAARDEVEALRAKVARVRRVQETYAGWHSDLQPPLMPSLAARELQRALDGPQ